jgi:hypothetical protein
VQINLKTVEISQMRFASPMKRVSFSLVGVKFERLQSRAFSGGFGEIELAMNSPSESQFLRNHQSTDSLSHLSIIRLL